MVTLDAMLQEARCGLARLFDHHRAIDEYIALMTKQAVILPHHPFNLSTWADFGLTAPVERVPFEHEISLIAHRNLPESPVHNMLIVLRYLLSSYSLGNNFSFCLRIIRAEYEKNWHQPNQYIHWYYFEVTSKFGTHICGGANDFSGYGGSARRELEQIFGTVALLHDVPVEDVSIPHEQAAVAEEFIKRACSAHERERLTEG